MKPTRLVGAKKLQFLRFLISGSINTVSTYALYLIFLGITTYKISYAISYISGIALSFALNKRFVFRSDRGMKSLILFPFIYVAQYLVGLFILWAWVDVAGLSKLTGPIAVVCVTIPITFFLSRAVFLKESGKKIVNGN
ncbi:GtrA family protein [Paraburkholderia sp.]|uniref:GtrA family protein n=1 Tax=Paraburkholderia sp. TaxID=1926495 RepID=UPI00345DEC96